ncbi:hypothetical protein UCREL1_2617 [Eutypa lata UCREL1]|uniref:Uncharacterized protein n=1 Tax=Eutypa lata (strain UCR-EL1) TaxID=1287681 RepID=M7SUX3_EUTLA|nr:hypothetical protein UCREL1_2617 [Eutypa lata UCREL1]
MDDRPKYENPPFVLDPEERKGTCSDGWNPRYVGDTSLMGNRFDGYRYVDQLAMMDNRVDMVNNKLSRIETQLTEASERFGELYEAVELEQKEKKRVKELEKKVLEKKPVKKKPRKNQEYT